MNKVLYYVKKTICFTLLALMFISCAMADTVDLSSMTYDELTELHKTLINEIISRPEWKEVIVPPGEYIVGIDIPMGRYTVYSTKYMVGVGIYADENKNDEHYDYFIIPSSDGSAVINLTNGNVVLTTAESKFTPYIGLGF